MSELRRTHQAEKAMPALDEQARSVLARLWGKFFTTLGVPGSIDVIREFLRGKAMDWIYAQLGPVGVWMVSYPLAFLTLGLIVVIIWFTVAMIREGRTVRESLILNHMEEPYKIQKISKKQAVATSVVAVTAILLLTYGTYAFFRNSPAALLRKYPLGYVIFKADYTSSVFPYDTRRLLDHYTFDWSEAGIIEDTPDRVWVWLPDIGYRGEREPFMRNVSVPAPKKVGGPLGGVRPGGDIFEALDFSMAGEVLAVNRNGLVFVIGFTPSRVRPMPPKR